MARDFHDIAFFRLGTFRAVLVNHPELIREILVTKQELFPKLGRQRKTIRLLDGNNLFVKQGTEWLRQRRLVQAAFHPSQMSGYAQTMVRTTRQFTERWSSGATVNFCDEMIELALAIIAKTMFDTDIGHQSEDLRKMVYMRSELFVREMGAIVRIPDWWPIPSKIRKRWVIKTTDSLIYTAIRHRRAEKRPRSDVLSALINAVDDDGKKMTDQQVRDEAVLMFHAGLDDVASVLTWLFYLVAKHPETQSRMVQEIHATMGDREPTYEDLPKFAFTEQVVKETLRLYPSTWLFTARSAAADVTVGSHQLKRGTWVFISPFVTQRDPRFFPEPLDFQPQRFSAERIKEIPRNAYFPFGAGPRMCAGIAFSMMEFVLVAITILQKFEMALDANQEPVEPQGMVTLRPNNVLQIKLTKRVNSPKAG